MVKQLSINIKNVLYKFEQSSLEINLSSQLADYIDNRKSNDIDKKLKTQNAFKRFLLEKASILNDVEYLDYISDEEFHNNKALWENKKGPYFYETYNSSRDDKWEYFSKISVRGN
jgi:hypothetical protein